MRAAIDLEQPLQRKVNDGAPFADLSSLFLHAFGQPFPVRIFHQPWAECVFEPHHDWQKSVLAYLVSQSLEQLEKARSRNGIVHKNDKPSLCRGLHARPARLGNRPPPCGAVISRRVPFNRCTLNRLSVGEIAHNLNWEAVTERRLDDGEGLEAASGNP